MRRVFWADEAASTLARLDHRTQKLIREKVSRLKDFPYMYEASEDPRFQGCRRFPVHAHYVVYYRLWEEGSDCFVVAIRDARMGPETRPATE